MKDILIVHTKVNLSTWHVDCRFQKEYDNRNTDRLTIVGIPNEEDKTLSIGVAFCTYPDNFWRQGGINLATFRASGDNLSNLLAKPYSVVTIEDFTQENCLQVLYDLHADLVSKSVKEVKKLVNQQIVK